MMKKFFLMSLASLAAAGAFARQVDRVVPIASDDNVKVELWLSAGEYPAPFTGTIKSCKDNSVLWQGTLAGPAAPHSDTIVVCNLTGLAPELWSPVSPTLYTLEVSSGEDLSTVRFGFRKFEMKDGNFYLNGKKIFLRGNAINPPGRGIPDSLEVSKDFARDYIRFLKGQNINMVRVPANQNWLDVCDEEGMMVFGGRYGRPVGGTRTAPPADLRKSFDHYRSTDLGAFTPHPSVMIYVLSNEMPHSGELGKAYDEFLQAVYEKLSAWDHTKMYIGNAGYGMGRTADVYDVHRYWGWYYNSHLTYLNMRDAAMWQNMDKGPQAITFTECVGNYTSIDGRFNLCSRTKQPGSQKCWTGHIPEDEQAEAALGHQAFVLKNAIESFRRMRDKNPYLSGIMPFTIMFHNWDGIGSFAEMEPKPVAYQYGVSYSPVLLSWEMWQPDLKAGNALDCRVHIVNDDDYGRVLSGAIVEWRIEDVNRMPVASGRIDVPEVEYYGTWCKALQVEIPEDTPTGEYTLLGTIIGADGKAVSHNSEKLFIASDEYVGDGSGLGSIKVYDRSGKTLEALSKLGVKAEPVTDMKKLSPKDVLVIGEDAWDGTLSGSVALLSKFTGKGGRIVCLRQSPENFDYSWIDTEIVPLTESNNDPEYLSPSYAYSDGMDINIERPDHPIFEGIDYHRMRLWSDYTGFTLDKDGFPRVYPVRDGFSVRNADLRNMTVLANYSRGLVGTALIEKIQGKGSVILSAFDLTSRCGVDPVAEKLLLNILVYASSDVMPEPYMPVTSVEWGSYASEKGLVTGANNGLVINPYPVVPVDRRDEYPLKVDARGYHYVVSYGGWNNRPGVQYLPRGRRPFAPFSYTKGGNDAVDKADEHVGEGYFLATVPQDAEIMKTVFENNSDSPVEIEILINDEFSGKYTVEPHSDKEVESRLPEERKVKVTFRGDRRTVILKTVFE